MSTNPLSSASALKVTASSVAGNNVHITVATVSGITYQLETSTLLTPLSWSEVGDPVTAEGASTLFTAPDGAGDPERFYRVKVVP